MQLSNAPASYPKEHINRSFRVAVGSWVATGPAALAADLLKESGPNLVERSEEVPWEQFRGVHLVTELC